jgi:catechol 2,3-dioxygenase-like lactoylglutathione lyase family enzyme
MECQLEHINMRVKNIDETLKFITTALPNFRVRGGKRLEDNRWNWVHVGTDSTYLCLNEDGEEIRAAKGPGLNHVGFVVKDAESIRVRLEQAGYEEGFVPDPHPYRQRIYYMDGNGIEWEFVEYHSEDPNERNDYRS